MTVLWSRVYNFLRREDGPTAVEYAVMLALILLVSIGAVALVGENTAESFEDSATSISNAISP